MKLGSMTSKQFTITTVFSFFLFFALSLTLAASFFVEARQAWQQLLRPVVYLDDWSLTHRPYLFLIGDMFKWLTGQHAEHRPILTRFLSVLETELLGLPIQATAGMQSFLLMLLNSALIAWIAHLVLKRRRSVALTWLSCSIIIFNPWQFSHYNLSGLTSLISVNTCLLASTLLLLGCSQSPGQRWNRCCVFGMAVLPWISIYMAGQGFAMVVVLVLTSILVSRRMMVVALVSSLLAVTTYFGILPFIQSVHRSKYGFNPDFLFHLLAGGSWPGFGVITGFVVMLVLFDRAALNQQGLKLDVRVAAVLAMPGFFAVVYALLVSMARSGYGAEGASASWYLTSLSMLPVSVVLIASWIYSSLAMQADADSLARPALTSFAPHLVVLIATLCSFPQVFTGQGVPFRQALAQVSYRRFQLQQSMECVGENLRKGYTEHTFSQSPGCVSADPAATEAYKFLRGRKPLKPRGWHLSLTRPR